MAKIAKKELLENGVKFAFVDGTEVVGLLDDIPQELITQLAIHGLSQKVGDSYAGAESVTEARRLAAGIVRNLVAGLWGAKVQRGGKVVEALARVTGRTLDEALEVWQGLDDEAQKALRKHAEVKKALADMEAERAAKLAAAAGDAGDDLTSLFG